MPITTPSLIAIPNPLLKQAIKSKKIKLWVLAPCLHTQDETIDYYCDFTQSIEEYTKVFAELNITWQWKSVNLINYADIIQEIVNEKEEANVIPVVLNLCDGDEINGMPGISVVRLLQEKELIFTGADEYFYDITTSKIPMKAAFDNSHVSNADWIGIESEEYNCKEIIAELGVPLIVKPAISGGSMGVGIKNVVENEEELEAILKQMFTGYHGWNLASGGIVAEKFITGPEFTVFITGSYTDPKKAVIYTPVQRVFHASLPDKEKFLSFDRLWEIYEEESAMPLEENFYEYSLPDEDLIEPLKNLSWEAYRATKGKGYTRVDIRMDAETKKLYVLEVNAQCGLSEDENFTSIGAILRLGGKTFSQLILEILNDAFVRYSIKNDQIVKPRNKVRA